ncbi:MAG: hypothetical protein IJ094_05690 [Bacilli bacterium]|nr:hypothetical protein [Bacilli bacterium]
MSSITIIMIITSIVSVIALYIDKHLLNIGITRKDYFYYMCLSMIPFSLVTLVIEYLRGDIRFDFSIIPFIILIFAMLFRYYKQFAYAGTVKSLTPYENMAYTSLGIVLAFIIDIILKNRDFNYFSFLAIILTIIGVFLLSNNRLRSNGLKKDLVIRIVGNVILGFIANIMLRYWSNAMYILLLNLFLTMFFSKDYTIKYHIKNKKIIKWVFIQQTFGFTYVYLFNYLSSISITTSNFVAPIVIMLLFLIALISKKNDKRIKFKDFISMILICIGMFLINLV